MGRSHYQRDSCLEGSGKAHSGWSPAEEGRTREEEGRGRGGRGGEWKRKGRQVQKMKTEEEGVGDRTVHLLLPALWTKTCNI